MNAQLQQSYSFISPIGELQIVTEANFIISISFPSNSNPVNYSIENKLIIEAANQLKAYFAGRLFTFNLPIKPRGTAFQKEIWEILKSIPFGKTRSYSSIAELAGGPHYTRAVGNANANNPIAVVIPCHRVIGVHGGLVGYAGGIQKKKWLLEHERHHRFGIVELFGPEI